MGHQLRTIPCMAPKNQKEKADLIQYPHKYLHLPYKSSFSVISNLTPPKVSHTPNLKMQAALRLPPTTALLPPPTPSRSFAATFARPTSRSPQIKAAATTFHSLSVNYNSTISVFPAEACDLIGGEACLADCYPEVRLKQEAANRAPGTSSEAIERDYFDYNEETTVFRAEACDDLGGLFCEPAYQRGVY